MFKTRYSIPSAKSVNPFISSLTQYGLTALTGCGFDGCPTIDGETHVLGIHLCAVGISDPSQLNGASYTTVLDCPGGISQDNTPLSNCKAADSADITCSAGSLAVTCDYEEFCGNVISNCLPTDFGVTDEGQFSSCPRRG